MVNVIIKFSTPSCAEHNWTATLRVLARRLRSTVSMCFPPHFVVVDVHRGCLHSERGPFLADIREHEHTLIGVWLSGKRCRCSTVAVELLLQNPHTK